MKAIIAFHSIDDSGSVLSFPVRLFESLLESLSLSNIPVLSLDELLKNETKKGIALTFDDGMKSVFSEALPVLKEYKLASHLYLTAGVVGKNNQWPTQPKSAREFEMLSWDDIERLQNAGMSIESHTMTHPDMRVLSVAQMEEECELADELIERHTGRRPQYFAYPYGFKNNIVCDFARNRYKGSVTTELKTLSHNDDKAQLPRLDSYYLQPVWLHKNLDSLLSKSYIALRGYIRTLRGTQ